MKISPELKSSKFKKIKSAKKRGLPFLIRRYFVYFWLKIRFPFHKKKTTLSKKIDFNNVLVKNMMNFISVARLILQFVAKLKMRISSRKADLLTERSAFFINDAAHLSKDELQIKFKFLSNKKIQNFISKQTKKIKNFILII